MRSSLRAHAGAFKAAAILATSCVLVTTISPPVAADEVNDSVVAGNLNAAQLSTYQGSLSSAMPYAQSFLATRSGRVTSVQVTLFLFTPGDPPVEPVSIELTNVDSTGTPAGATLATATIPASEITAKQPAPGVPPAPASLVTGIFASPAQIEAGQRYALVLKTNSGLNYAVSFADGASYPDGNQMLGSPYAPNGWFQYDSFDLIFAVHVASDPVAFAKFLPSAQIKYMTRDSARLNLDIDFKLGNTSDGFDLARDGLQMTLGSYSLTVDAGSGQAHRNGDYSFKGVIDGNPVTLRVSQLRNPSSYSLRLETFNKTLRMLRNPLTVALTIGDDGGSATIRAKIQR